MSESVDPNLFMSLPEEARWNTLRQTDVPSLVVLADTDFAGETVRAMCRSETALQDIVKNEVKERNPTAMDLRPLFEKVWGDNWQDDVEASSQWESAVVPQAESIMGNIETRLRNREYKDAFGNNPTDGQLWSAIQDMYLLSPERALDWLKKFEALPLQERRPAMLNAAQQPGEGGVWSFAPSVTYREIVSAVHDMYVTMDYFVEWDGKEVDPEFYNRNLLAEQDEPGFILREWVEGVLRIRAARYL